MHIKKGQDLLLEAVYHLIHNQNFKQLEVYFIGEGESERFLRNMTNELEITDYIHFMGSKDRNFLHNHLKDYDLLIQPSRYEGFGITIIEGMAAGLPVLVSDVNGPMEIIQNGKYGYFFKSEDTEDCAKKILKIKEDIQSGSFERKVTEIMKYVNDNFSIKVTASKYMQNY